MLITSYQPVCQPLSRRGLPANMLFLYARFALRRCNESWLEELLEGAVDRIEAGVYVSIYSGGADDREILRILHILPFGLITLLCYCIY